MSWLQPKLHLKVAQKQILTPGLVQMVSVLALNRLELREMITQEMVANPMLEELTDESGGRAGLHRRSVHQGGNRKGAGDRARESFRRVRRKFLFQPIPGQRRRRMEMANTKSSRSRPLKNSSPHPKD